MNEFEIQGRTIYKAARETKHDNGLSSFTLSFPVCEVSEWIKEPEQVLDILNSHDQLRAQLAEKDKVIERLREALEYIAESHDAGRHDGLPEPCPAYDAETMWAVANAALKGNADDTND